MNEILVPIAIILSLGVDILVIITLISLIRFLHKKS